LRESLGTSIRPSLIILPAVYVAAVALAQVLSMSTPGGAYYRLLPVNPFAAAAMMVVENDSAILAVLLVSGIPAWYLIGRIGWEGRTGRRSRVTLGLEALLSLLASLVCITLAVSVLRQDLSGGHLSAWAVIQYWLDGILCFGAILSTVWALLGALMRRDDYSQPRS
jgi:hypothetical protein